MTASAKRAYSGALLRIELGEVAALGDGAPVLRQQRKVALQPEDRAVLVQERVVFRAADTAAARCEDRARALAELCERGRLQRAEGILTAGGKDIRDGTPRRLDDLRIAVEQRPVQPLGEQRRDRALAAAGHADEDDVLHLLPHAAVDAQDLRRHQ